jgi:hypothetical protein
MYLAPGARAAAGAGATARAAGVGAGMGGIGAAAAGAAAVSVPPKPAGCYLVGLPEWGPAPPECTYGAMMSFLAGKDTIRLPDAYLFPPAGSSNLVDVQLPLPGHVIIHAITLSRIRYPPYPTPPLL